MALQDYSESGQRSWAAQDGPGRGHGGSLQPSAMAGREDLPRSSWWLTL